MKNGDGKDKHANARLEWMAYVGGNRESPPAHGRRRAQPRGHRHQEGVPRRLRPDDLGHRPARAQRAVRQEVPRRPVHLPGDLRQGRRSQARLPRPVPLLLLAEHPQPVHGRPEHQRGPRALGTIRVMRTIGMMGEVVGKAASICVQEQLLAARRVRELPRRAEGAHEPARPRPPRDRQRRRSTRTPRSPTTQRDRRPSPTASRTATKAEAAKPASTPRSSRASSSTTTRPSSPATGPAAPASTASSAPGTATTAPAARAPPPVFEFNVPAAGKYEVRFRYAAHENRADERHGEVLSADGEKATTVNQQRRAAEHGFVASARSASPGDAGRGDRHDRGTKGNVAIDAVQVVPAK